VIEALGWIGSPDALRALVWAAVEWQGATGPRQSGRMRPACKECGQYLAEALCRSPTPESVDALLGMTRRMDRLWSERTLSAVARVADERFVPFFVELCAGPARDVGLTGLRRTATDRAVPALLHILAAAPDRRTRDRAAQALATAVSADDRAWGRGWWEKSPDPTRRHPDPRVRRSMAWVAGRAAHPADGAVRDLRESLRDPDDLVRAQAVASLGLIVRDLVPPTSYLPDQDPQTLLLRALDDPCYRVRARAATAVGRLNLRREADELHLRHAARYDPVRCVRDAAEAALRARYHPVRKAPPGE
jgi:HEAT repeat protein